VPAISVLLPVRNALPYLASSLASLWRQTLGDFEVIAVDDGSTDGSGDLLERAAACEPRLHVIRTPPRGLPSALNTALARARAPLIARHDADDLSHRRRFELQREFLRAHPRVALAGSRLRLFPAPMVGVGMRRWAAWHNALLTHEAMASEMLIDSPLAHGTAMMRAGWLERVGGWAERGWAEDLDLWLRLLEAGGRFAKLPRVLYGWRQHRGSATRRDPRYRRERFIALKRAALERGILSGASSLTLVGVGESLERWRAALGHARRVNVVEARRPTAQALERMRPPVVLVFVAAPVRARWRDALGDSGMAERQAFIFVA
jgi:glycosyltransferase involved in cell wall biosynthesis